MNAGKYLLVLLLITFSCKTLLKSPYTKLEGSAFGTTFHIVYDNKTDFSEDIDSVFNAFNNSLSTYIPNSIISRVNKNDYLVEVDEYFIEAYNKAKYIYMETDGYFDPTIGRLIDAYGFGSGEAKELTQDEITSIMTTTGFDKVKLMGNKVIKKSDLQLNVNAFAKGFGVDVVGRFLETKGVENYLVEIGGEIRARGLNPDGEIWKIAIDDPNDDGTRSQSKFIELYNESMATSGNYRKFRINDKGEKIVHTVNPRTGLAKESNLLSASVILEGDCADVDAYATAFMAMGLENTKEFLRNHRDLKVVLLYTNDSGKISEFRN